MTLSLSEKELEQIVEFNAVQGASAHRALAALLRQGISLPEALSRVRGAELFSEAAPASCFQAAQEIENCAKRGIRLVSYQDADYPASLRFLEDAPLLLYVKGSLIAEDEQAVAVVGARDPSSYGLEQARRLGRELAESGLTVVSGFARGIDQAAHEGSLGVRHGRTIAVLGCGLDQVYPRGSEKLFEKISQQGAMLSEFPLGTGPQAWNFPRRNRIISGLARGVLVIEAHLKSGSLITARLAAEQGREVLAMPGPVDQWTSRGTHQLLREGAVLVESAADVVEALAYTLKTPALSVEKPAGNPELPEKEPQKALFGKGEAEPVSWLMGSLGAGPLFYDELIERMRGQTAKPPAELFSELLALEVSGLIRRQEDGRFILT